MSRLGIFALWLLHFLPLVVLAPVGLSIGMLAYAFIAKRRRIARTNLRLCFPELTRGAREKLLRRHFRAFGRAILESGIAWWGSPARLRKVVRLAGAEHIAAVQGQPVIAFVPHFVGIELGGMRMSADYRGAAVYVRQKDAFVDAFLKRKRERFPGSRMILRQEGVKAIIAVLRSGQALQLSPDMDLGARDSLFVPFFGVQTATVPALSRIARLARARILPVVVRQLPWGRGYEAQFYPAWESFPGSDAGADTQRMNAFLEECIREMPEQYLWTHRRFKTRPEGLAPVY